MSLQGKTMFISGASRGIGLAIALKAAAEGANVAMIAKTDKPHPKLEGTMYTAAEAIEEGAATRCRSSATSAGRGRCSPPSPRPSALRRHRHWVNNASAINLPGIGRSRSSAWT